MKIQNKLLLIFIVFLGIIVFNDPDSYASYTYTDNFIEKCHALAKENMDSYYNSYLLINNNGNAVDIFLFHDNCTPIIMYSLLQFEHTTSMNLKYAVIFPSSNYCNFNAIDGTHDGSNIYKLTNCGGFNREDVIFSTVDVFYHSTYGGASKYYSFSHVTDDVIFSKPEPDKPDKLNLYELNMTDLDDNNKKHQFNIVTYTNSPCYDELMEYYNKDYQYAIYLTDYERILTYQNYDDDNSFLYGSYVMSGYIDFLITDKSFFYYSEYYKQVMSDSGNAFFNKDISDYTKRFYFKLTYSEDSNDPHATIWADNGNLFAIDYLESFEDRYFVGSSQTIYYANENSKGNFKDLTKDIYYLGYLNPTGGKTRDISEIPFYTYNFDFAGGTTELYIVNQTDYDYEQMIKSRYDNWEEYYDDWTILTDASIGGSYFQGNDFTSSTFEKGKVTDDTSVEDDQTHIGEIRTASDDTDVIDKNKETEAGVTDGSIITDLINTVKDKFGFSNNIVNNANEIKDYIVNTQETHKYYLNINHKYLNGQVCIIDLSWYEPYKPTVDAFICAFAYLAFIWHMFCKIPDLIRGASATSYASEIQAYTSTGAGRSSNIHKGGF